MSEDVWLKTTCYGCPAATCGMLAHRVNGVVVEVRRVIRRVPTARAGSAPRDRRRS